MKKILALALVAMLALSMIVPSFADYTDPTLASEIDGAPASLAAGDKVTVNAVIYNNPGMSSIAIRVGYDTDAFEIVSGTKTIKNGGDVFEALNARSVKDGTARASFFAEENTEEDGILATFVFTAKAAISSGEYEFPITCTQCWDVDDQPVTWEIASCKLSFAAAADPTAVDVDMNATVGEDNDVQGNIIVSLPEGVDAADYTVTVGATNVNLGDLTEGANGYVVPAPAVSPKQMGDTIAWAIYYDNGADAIVEGTTSLKAYAEALAAEAATAELGEAMLTYGAAAQVAFDYNSDNLVGDPTAAPEIVADRFAANSLNAILAENSKNSADYAPVTYSAINLTYTAEITLSMAFRVKDNATLDEAAEWVEENIKLNGADVTATTATAGEYKFVIISYANILVNAIADPIAITVNGAAAGSVCPANYLASMEASYGKVTAATAEYLNLARALFAYAAAINATIA